MVLHQVDATLQVEQPDESLAPLAVAADAPSPTDVALPVLDAATRASLTQILAALSTALEVTGEVALDEVTLAALETIHAVVDNWPGDFPDSAAAAGLAAILAQLQGTLAVDTGLATQTDALTDAELRAEPVQVAGTVVVTGTDLDVRPLDADEDSITNRDANESSMTYATVDFNGSGDHTIVAVAGDKRLRLRRFLLTSGDPDADPPANPVLTVSLGGQTLRTTALIGRFNLLGDPGEDFIIHASKAGQVDGTAGYVLEDA